jgi:hypothetical protein
MAFFPLGPLSHDARNKNKNKNIFFKKKHNLIKPNLAILILIKNFFLFNIKNTFYVLLFNF